ncbi:hypothetical protein Q757_01020 [Oenococcus alcoholitolerans]|uniref:Amino acid permease n=1 Tax=Oenococcus alcoholitolerans TaxID=931074 RepID=A0ABR4XTS0_9LACO|nr:hypothetical protein Q757_01020 [Oenococcus alcoholitolerans]
MMPQILAKRNKFGAPYISIIVSTLLGLLLAYSGTFSTLAQISAVSRFAQFIPTIVALMVFRKTMAHAPREFKVPFGWLIPVLALAVSVWLLFNTPVLNILWGFGALIIAIPFIFNQTT